MERIDAKPESRVVLYDAEGKKIGETFSRRARQLVKQQRALWVDDSHTALRFMPDVREEAEEAWESDEEALYPETLRGHEDAALLAIARKRLSTRRWFYVYTVFLLPGYAFLAMAMESIFWVAGPNRWVTGFAVGVALTAWTALYAFVIYRFVVHNGGFFPFRRSKARHERKIASEVAFMKRMGY